MKRAIKGLATNTESLRDFVALVAPVLTSRHTEQLQKDASSIALLVAAGVKAFPEDSILDDIYKAKLLEKVGNKLEVIPESQEAKEGRKSFRFQVLDQAAEKSLTEAMERLAKTQYQETLLYRSALISLVSAAEWFLSRLLHKYFEKFPDAVGIAEKSFSLSDLQSFGSVEDARSFLIDNKVEEILRGSFEDWISFLKNRPKLSMSYLEPNFDNLVEVFQRRNLFVHNNGIINHIYLARVKKDLRAGFLIGDELISTKEYVEKAITLFEKSFILLGAEFWKKLEPQDEARGDLLIELAFSNLQGERWDVAEALSYFLVNDSKLRESDRTIAKINYWIAKKAQGCFEDLREQVATEDFSAKDELFGCAHRLLLDDEPESLRLLAHLLEIKKLTSKELQAWPLFRWIRDSPGFIKLLESAKESETSISEIGSAQQEGEEGVQLKSATSSSETDAEERSASLPLQADPSFQN